MMNNSIVSDVKIIPIKSDDANTSVVQQVAALLRAGQIVVVPTETRYGLIANANDSEALDTLYKIKGRPMLMPTAIFVESIDAIKNYGIINKNADKLANEFLPGPLTLVLASDCSLVQPIVHENKIGIRLSSSYFIQALVKEIDFPITATSANLSGQADSVAINEIVNLFGNQVSAYVDGGVLDGATSTVVDVSDSTPIILREGAIPSEFINKVLGI